MAKSKDVSELTHMWQQWHDETGRPLRSKFIRYVELSNEAARLNGKSNQKSGVVYRIRLFREVDWMCTRSARELIHAAWRYHLFCKSARSPVFPL